MTLNVHSQKYSIGNEISGDVELTDGLTINLQGDGWVMVRKEFSLIKTIRQKIWGFIRVENGEFMEGYDMYEGDVGGNWIGWIDNFIVEATFKGKYDGCYNKPRYYLVEFYRKGRTHNCMVISQITPVKRVSSSSVSKIYISTCVGSSTNCYSATSTVLFYN